MNADDGLREVIVEALAAPQSAAFYDALLPAITAWAEQRARERAAEELRAIAAVWEKQGNGWRALLSRDSSFFAFARAVRARADVLSPR